MSDETWKYYHHRAEILASQARCCDSELQVLTRRNCYSSAAAEEEKALPLIPLAARRTRGIVAVSAASCWLKAGNTERAAEVARRMIEAGTCPKWAVAQLLEFLPPEEPAYAEAP